MGRKPKDGGRFGWNFVSDLTHNELQAMEAFSRRAVVELIRGNRDRAHDVIDEADRALESIRRQEVGFLDVPLADIGLDARHIEALETHLNVKTVGDVVELRPEQLTSTPGITSGLIVDLHHKIVNYIVPRHIRMERLVDRRVRIYGA